MNNKEIEKKIEELQRIRVLMDESPKKQNSY